MDFHAFSNRQLFLVFLLYSLAITQVSALVGNAELEPNVNAVVIRDPDAARLTSPTPNLLIHRISNPFSSPSIPILPQLSIPSTPQTVVVRARPSELRQAVKQAALTSAVQQQRLWISLSPVALTLGGMLFFSLGAPFGWWPRLAGLSAYLLLHLLLVVPQVYLSPVVVLPILISWGIVDALYWSTLFFRSYQELHPKPTPSLPA